MSRFHAPPPGIQPEAARFWGMAVQGQLWLPRCTACARLHFYPRAICPHCQGQDLRWEQVPQDGRLHSFTVVEHPPTAHFKAMTPYVPAICALAEGVHLPSRVLCGVGDLDRLRIDMPVRLVFRAECDGLSLPLLELTGD